MTRGLAADDQAAMPAATAADSKISTATAGEYSRKYFEESYRDGDYESALAVQRWMVEDEKDSNVIVRLGICCLKLLSNNSYSILLFGKDVKQEAENYFQQAENLVANDNAGKYSIAKHYLTNYHVISKYFPNIREKMLVLLTAAAEKFHQPSIDLLEKLRSISGAKKSLATPMTAETFATDTLQQEEKRLQGVIISDSKESKDGAVEIAANSFRAVVDLYKFYLQHSAVIFRSGELGGRRLAMTGKQKAEAILFSEKQDPNINVALAEALLANVNDILPMKPDILKTLQRLAIKDDFLPADSQREAFDQALKKHFEQPLQEYLEQHANKLELLAANKELQALFNLFVFYLENPNFSYNKSEADSKEKIPVTAVKKIEQLLKIFACEPEKRIQVELLNKFEEMREKQPLLYAEAIEFLEKVVDNCKTQEKEHELASIFFMRVLDRTAPAPAQQQAPAPIPAAPAPAPVQPSPVVTDHRAAEAAQTAMSAAAAADSKTLASNHTIGSALPVYKSENYEKYNEAVKKPNNDVSDLVQLGISYLKNISTCSFSERETNINVARRLFIGAGAVAANNANGMYAIAKYYLENRVVVFKHFPNLHRNAVEFLMAAEQLGHTAATAVLKKIREKLAKHETARSATPATANAAADAKDSIQSEEKRLERLAAAGDKNSLPAIYGLYKLYLKNPRVIFQRNITGTRAASGVLAMFFDKVNPPNSGINFSMAELCLNDINDIVSLEPNIFEIINKLIAADSSPATDERRRKLIQKVQAEYLAQQAIEESNTWLKNLLGEVRSRLVPVPAPAPTPAAPAASAQSFTLPTQQR
jgi:tetratricopeptide (TPR) repeat protein